MYVCMYGCMNVYMVHVYVYVSVRVSMCVRVYEFMNECQKKKQHNFM